MNFPEHSRAGWIAGVVTLCAGVVLTSRFDKPLLWAIIVYIGAVFPDLDTDSIPSRWAARLGFAFAVIMMFLKKPWPPAIAGALFFLIKSGKHRGFTHKWAIPISLIFAGFTWDQSLCFAFAGGLLIHFAVDKISPFAMKNWW